MSVVQVNRSLVEAVRALETSLQALDTSSRAWADADRDWRHARAQAYLRSKGTVGEREAFVEMETGDLRYAANLAESAKIAGLEAVRSRRTIVSAWQSVAGVERAEAQLQKWGPRAVGDGS